MATQSREGNTTTCSPHAEESTTRRRTDRSHRQMPPKADVGPPNRNSCMDLAGGGTNLGCVNAMDSSAQESQPTAGTNLPDSLEPGSNAKLGSDGVPQQADGENYTAGEYGSCGKAEAGYDSGGNITQGAPRPRNLPICTDDCRNGKETSPSASGQCLMQSLLSERESD